MSVSPIAYRYAKPLLELANEKGVVEAVKADLTSFLAICKESRDFALMLKNPIIPHLKKLSILKSVFAEKFNELTLSVFDIIAKKNREALLQDIANAFIILYNQSSGIQGALVKTTFPIGDDLKSQFSEIVEKVTGKKAQMSYEIDPELIGGFVLKIGDQQIDDSVSSKLKELKKTLV